LGTIYNLVDKAIRLSNPMFHEKNLRHCIELLRDNGYPLDVTFREINLRIKKLFNEKLIKGNTNDNVKNKENIQKIALANNKFSSQPPPLRLSQHNKISFYTHSDFQNSHLIISTTKWQEVCN